MSMAAQGLRDMDDGAEAIINAEELALVRRQALRIAIYSLISGGLATGLFLALP